MTKTKRTLRSTPTWSCPSCTFLNQLVNPICEVCGVGQNPKGNVSKKGVWLFEEHGSWFPMYPEAQKVLEDNYAKDNFEFEAKIRGVAYQYDLEDMTQVNVATGFERSVKRDAPEDESDEEEDEVDIWIPIKVDKNILKEDCSLCTETFKPKDKILKLKDCVGHYFHEDCNLQQTIVEFIEEKKKCPVCSKFYGAATGNMPDGSMDVTKIRHSIPGSNCNSAFQLEFNFPGGIQGPKHPKPGKRFHGDGRVAFLPDNTEGNKVLRLFRKGWKRKLLFTIGYSQTRQIDDVLIYNGIHMKTSPDNSGSHGYPDPGYLQRVTDEFKTKGIV